ncbi:glycosylase [Microbacterium sp. QXD-8]|uniref:Glycosylase n=1 Tax=Microbacterium psychrotolerans TaxID=3068321 RepID=A0ABU0Z1L4_9MICO|nr:glycosylase [Microbacterium sp. QXD-8]MDQ7878470.1 glycosylase [Microbacterium sp. QXD-8]
MILEPHPAALHHEPSRVVDRLFLPGEETRTAHSRMLPIIERVRAVPREEVSALAEAIVADFATRQPEAASILLSNAHALVARVDAEHDLTDAQLLVVGSAFTAQYAVEGAALCNPSAVEHPSQAGLGDGELRVAVSLRCIGEGHTSSIGFAEAVIGADDTWVFGERATPPTRADVAIGTWSRADFARTLDVADRLDDLAGAVLAALPDRFTGNELEAAIEALPTKLAMRPTSRRPMHALRDVAASRYRLGFDADVELSARTIMPVLPEEDRGVEDARFVRFIGGDGGVEYRGTYTAYDGRTVGPRLLTSPDLVSFESQRLGGSGARGKGMALFPRLVDGRHLAIARGDGENIGLSSSDDGVLWDDLGVIHAPTEVWELIQLGNCGSPIETSRGWLLLTHGVGPLRTYSLGALLLDLDDPSRILARTREPLLTPEGDMVDGYVPRVVYSCGGIVHRERLWVPTGIGDSRIRMYSAPLDRVWDAMS